MKKKPVVFFSTRQTTTKAIVLKDKAIILKTRRIFHKIYTFTLKTR